MAGGGQSLLVDGVRRAVVGAGLDILRRPPSTGERRRVRVEAEVLQEGKRQCAEVIAYYMENARIIRQGLQKLGYAVYGGVNAPYIWLKTPGKTTSWAFFDELLGEVQIVGTPGAGFGPNGEGYLRLTAFGSRENTERAMERMKKLAI